MIEPREPCNQPIPFGFVRSDTVLEVTTRSQRRWLYGTAVKWHYRRYSFKHWRAFQRCWSEGRQVLGTVCVHLVRGPLPPRPSRSVETNRQTISGNPVRDRQRPPTRLRVSGAAGGGSSSAPIEFVRHESICDGGHAFFGRWHDIQIASGPSLLCPPTAGGVSNSRVIPVVSKRGVSTNGRPSLSQRRRLRSRMISAMDGLPLLRETDRFSSLSNDYGWLSSRFSSTNVVGPASLGQRISWISVLFGSPGPPIRVTTSVRTSSSLGVSSASSRSRRRSSLLVISYLRREPRHLRRSMARYPGAGGSFTVEISTTSPSESPLAR